MDAPTRKAPDASWSLHGVYEEYTAYQKGGLCALSGVAYLRDEHLPPHWEWIISFSYMGRERLNNAEINQCLKDFGAEDFEEDNHEPGIARKFWLAAEHQYRKPCLCKDEEVITEGDYKYSVKKS